MKEDILEKFKKEDEKKFCHLCHKVVSDYGKISIRAHNTKKRYVGSGRPVISTYGIVCCIKCHEYVMDKIRDAILNKYDNNKQD